jgi:HEAT repeat protein
MSRLLWAVPLLVATFTPELCAQNFLGKPREQWQTELASRDATLRRSAAFALGKLGAQAAPAVRDLRRALNDPDPTVADAAAYALGEIGPQAANAVDDLVALLGDPKKDAQVRRSAAIALAGIKDRSNGVCRALRRALDDSSPAVRQNAAWALGRLKPEDARATVQSLGDRLTDTDAVVRRDSAVALGEIGPEARRALPVLVRTLKQEKDGNVQKAVLSTLVNIVDPEDTAVAEAVRPLLRDSDPETARAAAFALGNIGGPKAAPAVPILSEALHDADVALRRLASGALANIGPEAAPAVGDLIRALSDDDDDVRASAARALAHIGAQAEPAVPYLVKNLERRQPDLVRKFSCEALAHIGKGLKPVIPELMRALREDPDPSVRQRAVWALGRLNADDLERSGAVEELVATFADTSDKTVLVRYEAARYLAIVLGPRAPEKCIDVLLTMLRDTGLQVYTRTDSKVSTSGTETGGGSSEAKANLGGDARFLPLEALGRMGASANRPEVIKSVEEAGRGADPKLKQAAKEALQKIKGP